MTCYFISDPSRRGYRKRMHDTWRERNPDFEINEQRLMDQRRAISSSAMFTPTELAEIQRDVEHPPHANANDHHPPTSAEGDLTSAEGGTQPEAMTPETLPTGEDNQLLEEIQQELQEVRGKTHRDAVWMNKQKMPEIRELTAKANHLLKHIHTDTITETNALTYATARVVSRRTSKAPTRKKGTNQIPPWKRRLQNDVKSLRRDISRMEASRGGRRKLSHDITKRYWVDERGIKTAIEDAKQRLTAVSHRLQRYEARVEQFRVNRMFVTQPGRVYSQFKRNTPVVEEPQIPDKGETYDFWKGIWGTPKTHNADGEWAEPFEIPVQRDIRITEKDIKSKVKKMPNWKSPGPDQIQGFWLKYLTSLHGRLASQFQAIVDYPDSVPPWLTQGRTVLIQKDPAKGTTPSNYRPITCLPTTWKLLSGILADQITTHLNEHDILAYEQKGARPGCRGTKDQLLLDKVLTRDSRRRRTNLAVGWIDYKKAYDSVPHSWIIHTMRSHKVNPKITRLVEKSMENWSTSLTSGGKHLADIKIECGIFQGDALSPLLFCVALNPLSHLLRRAKQGYQLKTGHKINHLLYMDDLKLYAKNENDLTALIETTRIFSDNICMKFGLDKCARQIIHRGKIKLTDGLDLTIGKIRDADTNEGYKYLGILQNMENKQREVKDIASATYRRKLRHVLKSKLNGQNKIHAMNTYALPVITYTAGIIDWTQHELAELDRKTRKTMNMYGGLHPRADVHRLYIPRKSGGRGLKGVAATMTLQCAGLQEYIEENRDRDPLIEAVWRNDGLTGYKSKKESKADWQKECTEEWAAKPLHGQYRRQVPEITSLENAYRWMSQPTGLKVETEALITAAQDQALNTKCHQAKVIRTSNDPKCRMCNQKDETVAHIITACSKIAGSLYKTRHNNVAAALHHGICRHYGVQTCDNTWLHDPKPTEENERAKILWDFEIRTDRVISARRPDLVVVDKTTNETTIIDVAIPNDTHIVEKEREKVGKYQDLRLEIQRLWNTKARVVPVVIGALGAVSNNLDGHLGEIPGEHGALPLTKTALLGSAHILRRVLDLPESG